MMTQVLKGLNIYVIFLSSQTVTTDAWKYVTVLQHLKWTYPFPTEKEYK